MSSPDCIFSARTLKGALDQAGQVYPSGFDIADETFSGGMLNRRVTITVIPYVPAAEPVAPVIGEDDTETAAAADTGPVAEQDAADAEQLGPQPATAPDLSLIHI